MRKTARIKMFISAVVVLAAALAVTGLSSGVVASKAAATRVTVTMRDRSFTVTPGILQSGTTTFVVRNAGKKGHVFSISGPGLKRARTGLVSAGETAMLTVNLRTGSYMLADPALGPYSAEYVNVIRAESLTGRGNGNAVAPVVTAPPMCGATYAP